MRIVGLDLGTTMGFAFTDSEHLLTHQTGTMNFANKRHENGGMRFIRFKKFLEEVTDGVSIAKGEAECVIFYEEVVYHRGADAAHVYGGWIAVLQSYCDERGIAYSGVPIGTIKKRATGSGRANKQDMVRASMREWGVEMTHDQADAAWVLQCGLDELYGGNEPDAQDFQH